jgi:hypothetical protein
MRAFEKIMIISLTLLLSMSLNAAAAEEESQEVEKIDVPEAVMEAFAREYPEMGITGIETEEIDGVVYYEIECGEGEMDVIYLADGSLYAVEQEIDVGDLPQPVVESINGAYPEGEIVESEMITRGSETGYEVVVVIEEEDEESVYEVIVTSDGKIKSEQQILEEEDDDDEDYPGDSDADYEEDEN